MGIHIQKTLGTRMMCRKSKHFDKNGIWNYVQTRKKKFELNFSSNFDEMYRTKLWIGNWKDALKNCTFNRIIDLPESYSPRWKKNYIRQIYREIYSAG